MTTTDPFTTAARAEAERVWRSGPVPPAPVDLGQHMAEWARDQLAAEDSADLDDMAHRLSSLLDECTGGLLSKTNYTVEVMVREIEDHYRERFRIEQAEEDEEEEPTGALVDEIAEQLDYEDDPWDRTDPDITWGLPGNERAESYRDFVRRVLTARRARGGTK